MEACTYEQMMALFAAQTATLTEKIDVVQKNVKSEIKNAVDPVIERQDKFEAKTAKQYEDMVKQISQIKLTMALPNTVPDLNPSVSSTPAPSYAQIVGTASGANTEHQARSSPSSKTSPSGGSLMEIIHRAERTIGFQPICASDVDDICRIHRTDDPSEAMKLVVIEFLKFEMKNSVTKLANIVHVFPRILYIFAPNHHLKSALFFRKSNLH